MLEWLLGKSFDCDKDVPDLSGKVILVTGGNAGLGKETVLQLAKHNPREIFLAARNASKAAAAIDEINSKVPNSRVTFLQLDLTSFAAIKKAAEDFQARADRLDILINNAGIMAVPYSKTEEGYEIQFGTNHMGHALLTKLLLPTMLSTAEEKDSDVRVVNLSSRAHQGAPWPGIVYDQDALEGYGTYRRYGQSKLANILHVRELARRYPSITAVSVHPGVIITDLYGAANQSNFIVRWGTWASKSVLGGVPWGAKNQMWAAVGPKHEVRSSYYWKPIGIPSAGTRWHAQKPELAEKLWDWTEEEFRKYGY
ncbi:oxidoreductase [Polychaeton citri CBS 116435]|uniref:Oxidoreductase n=1 Tax=Polychaeton citri CBS 116435 TaxID=1314669 RepID=A0A9P4PZR6_9PEZI|nr:oxidoreductase [Polychaeton citri CBS 116435]